MIYTKNSRRPLLLMEDMMLLTEKKGCQTITSEGREETDMDFKYHHPGFWVDKYHVRLWSTLNDHWN